MSPLYRLIYELLMFMAFLGAAGAVDHAIGILIFSPLVLLIIGGVLVAQLYFAPAPKKGLARVQERVMATLDDHEDED